jgi:hypothetical protein
VTKTATGGAATDTTLVAATGSGAKTGTAAAASGTSTATSSAQKIEIGAKWMGIVAGLVGLWVIPVMYL